MLSRRTFLIASCGLAFAPLESALARRSRGTNLKAGPRALSIQSWPPSIVPDHVAIIEHNYCALADEYGHLAVVDFRNSRNIKIVGELRGIAKKITDFVALPRLAYAIGIKDSPAAEPKPVLLTIKLAPASEPTVVSEIELNQFTEASCLAATPELVVVGGVDKSGSHKAAVFSAASAHGRKVEPSLLSTAQVQFPLQKLVLEDRTLIALTGGHASRIDVVSLLDPANPKLIKQITPDGRCTAIAASKDFAIAAGERQDGSICQATLLFLGSAPHAVQSINLPDLEQVYDIAMQKNAALVLGETEKGLACVRLSISKNMELLSAETCALSAIRRASGPSPALAVKDRFACVATGWSGAEVLNYNNQTGWSHKLIYRVPHLPASGIATWNNWVVLSCADLKVYDIAKPNKPFLLKATDKAGSVKSMAGAGSFVLCLGKEQLALRKIENLDKEITAIKISGQQVAFDGVSQKAFVLSSLGKKASITPVQVYSDQLVADKPLDIANDFHRAAAVGGYLLLSSLNEIALYEATGSLRFLGKHTFDNLAVRDIALTDEYVICSCINPSSKGYLVILSKEQKDLPLLSTAELSHDGIALSVSGKRAVVIGKSTDGKDLASIVDLSNAQTPKEIASLPVVDAASAVTIKDNLAIIAGRGLEILTLS